MSPVSRPRDGGRHRDAGHTAALRPGSRLVPALVLAMLLVASGGTPSIPSGGSEHAEALLAVGADRPGPLGGAARASLREGSTTSASRIHSRTAARTLGTHAGAARASATAVSAGAWMATSRAAAKVKDASDEAASSRYTRPVQGRVTSEFGPRWGRMHNGIDVGAPHGAGLYAVAAATVTATDYSSGLGHHVTLRLPDGTEVTYGHMSRIAVERGQQVSAGARVGDVGNTGRSTGAHLHLEVRTPQGTRIDPRPWLKRHGIL